MAHPALVNNLRLPGVRRSVLSVKELVFRGKDRYRSYTWMPLWVLGFGLVVAGIPAVFRVGNTVGLCWVFGLGTAVSSVANFIVFRSWTRVGSAGITICRGIGRRGRTYPWQEIRWVDIRETKQQGYVARGSDHALGRAASLAARALLRLLGPRSPLSQGCRAGRQMVGVEHGSGRTVCAA